jgi:hypothetical protein
MDLRAWLFFQSSKKKLDLIIRALTDAFRRRTNNCFNTRKKSFQGKVKI